MVFPGMGGGGAPAAPAQGGGGGTPGAADTPEFQQQIDIAVSALHKAVGMQEDPQDIAVVSKCLDALHQFKGTQQKQKDAALGITDVHRGVRRAIRASSGGGGGGPAY